MGIYKKELKCLLKLDRVSSNYDLFIYLVPLAYLMAKSHGLTEFEKTLEESIKTMDGVDQEKIFEQAE